MYIIAGYLKGRRIIQPPLLSTRPTSARVRECIFNIINHQLSLQNNNYESLSVLDVFAGSGALGFEALSRGCHKLTLIDNHIDAVNVLYANADHLNVKDKVKIWRLNPLNLKASRDPYSLIFIDPPYGQNLIAKTLQVLSAHHWIANNAMIISEWGADESEKYDSVLTGRNYQLTTLATRSFNHCTINVSRYNKLD